MRRSRIAAQALALCALLLAAVAPLTASAHEQAAPRQAEGSAGNPCIAPNADVGYNSSCGPEFQLPRWSDADNWDQPQYYETILLADFDGDGDDELLARSAAGFLIYSWDATLGQWQDKGPQTFPSPWGFSDAAGWDEPRYYSTIQAAHLTSDTQAWLLLLSASGIDAFEWDGDKSWTVLPAGPRWEWTDDSNYSTIQTWRNWLIGRGPDGIQTWRFENNAWRALADSGQQIFSDAAGWNKPQYYETIKLLDLDGDDTPELVGRGVEGMQVFSWSGSDWRELSTSRPFPDATGWDQTPYYRTIQYANVDNDPKLEMFARSADGMQGFQWDGADWQPMDIAPGLYTDAQGWDAPQYYETIQFMTLDNGSGIDTLVGRDNQELFFHSYDAKSKSFVELGAGPALSNGPNDDYPLWSSAGYYKTIHFGDGDGDGADDLIARGMFGLRTWTYDADAKTWQRPVAYGFTPFSGADNDAYTALNNLLGPFSEPQNDPTIRGQYTTTDAPTLDSYKAALEAQSTPPSGCSGECANAWPTVRQQILSELDDAYWTASYFSELAALFSQIFAAGDNELTTIAQQLLADSKPDTRMQGFLLALFLDAFSVSGALAGGAGGIVTGFLAGAIGATQGLASSGNFDGSLADADQQYTTHRQEIVDQLQNERVYVAADAGLLTTVAQARRTTIWDPSDPWVTRATVSTGRKQVAIWSYQAIAPSFWEIVGLSWVYLKCDDNKPPADDVRYLYVNNPRGECYREVEKHGGDIAPKNEVENILLADNCVPTQSNSVWWEYGTCNLGMDVHDFFYSEGGWRFKYSQQCLDCGSGAAPDVGLEVQPYHDDRTINLDASGTLPVALHGTAERDVRFVDPATVTFAGAHAEGWWIPAEPSSLAVIMPPSVVQDVNGDGMADLILQFEVQQLQLVPGVNTVTMHGSMVGGGTFGAFGTANVICVNNCPTD